MPFDLLALQTLLPSRNQLIAWLDRSKTYPECGFFILNCGHKDYWKLIDGLEELYVTDKIYQLAEWTDCHAMEQMIMLLRAETRSLSGNIGQHSNHPFVNGPLGRWFDHLKGNRKRMGRTPTGDLMRQREEPYWRNRRW
jgi:hypothetical protein